MDYVINCAQYVESNLCFLYLFSKGRYDLDKFKVHCKECDASLDPLTKAEIVRAGFWPGSPSDINHIFDQSLFEFWDALQKRMPGTSQNSFVRSLEDFSQIKGRVSNFLA